MATWTVRKSNPVNTANINQMPPLFWQGARGSLFCYFRQYRIILSADTASEVRQMLSQKRR